MKLLLCRECGDIFNLSNKTKSCSCGKTSGRYINNLDAKYSGGIPLGFANSSLVEALRNQPQSGQGKVFTAFVIPQQCPTMVKNEDIQKQNS